MTAKKDHKRVLFYFQWAGIRKDGGSFVFASPFAVFTCACVRKMLPVRSAPLRSASLISAPIKSVILRSAFLKSAAMSSAPLRFAPRRSSPFSFAPIRTLPRLIFFGSFVLRAWARTSSLVFNSHSLTSARSRAPAVPAGFPC